jgi:hypothetical protein
MNNSNEQTSPQVSGLLITSPLTSAPSPSAVETIIQNEAPLLALKPGVSLLSPSKPLIEMTDAELQAWHGRLREHRNHMTMMAHLTEVSTVKPKKETKPKKDMSEFV